jgi:hypothetical protein
LQAIFEFDIPKIKDILVLLFKFKEQRMCDLSLLVGIEVLTKYDKLLEDEKHQCLSLKICFQSNI